MWNNIYQKIGNGHDLMHVRVQKKQMCRKYPEIGGKIFVTENSGIGPKKLLLIKQIIFLQSHFNWWDKTYKIIPRRAFQFVSRIFFGKPSQKDSEYTTYKYVFNVADKEFSQ